MSDFKNILKDLNACSDALQWLGNRTANEALRDCHRGDWLLWWFWRERNTVGFPGIRSLTKVKSECARLVQHLMKDERSIKALDACDQFYDGIIGENELRAACAAAYAADAAADAAYAAYAADAADARPETLKKCADICRKYLSVPDDYCKHKPVK